MFELSIWILVSYFAWYLLCLIFSFPQAKLGHNFGAKVEYFAIGFSLLKRLRLELPGKNWTWRIGLFPMNSSVKFFALTEYQNSLSKMDWEEIELPPGSFHSLSTFQMFTTILSGPIGALVFGLFMLAISVCTGEGQLYYSANVDSTVSPFSIAGLETLAVPSSFSQQFELLLVMLKNVIRKYFLFQSSGDWGGWVWSIASLGSIGTKSLAAWFTCIGCMSCILGFCSLLPIPCMTGFLLLTCLADSILGKNRTERTVVALSYVGYLYLVAVFARIIIADVYWGLSQFN